MNSGDAQTRTKLKEAFDIHTAAVIERAEKQIVLARHARRLLNFIDDSPVVPGDARQAYDHELEARQVLEDAENDLRSWVPNVEPIDSDEARVNGNGVNGVHAEDSDELTAGTEANVVADEASSHKQLDEPLETGATEGAKLEAEPAAY